MLITTRCFVIGLRYAMLVGQPPFETATLTETYSRIAHNMYIIPECISRSARSLIRQLLAPDPRHRPTLDQVLKHDFFSSGIMPSSLPAYCCSKAPSFANDSGIKSVDYITHITRFGSIRSISRFLLLLLLLFLC